MTKSSSQKTVHNKIAFEEVNATSFNCLAALARTLRRQMRSEKKSHGNE